MSEIVPIGIKLSKIGSLDLFENMFKIVQACLKLYKLVWNGSKLCFEMKMTKLGVGHFTSISGHFFANYIDIFHKIELPTFILMCLTCLNLIWIKSYDINHNLIWKLCFSILEEKTLKIKFQKWPFLDHLWSFFGIYIDIFHKTEIQTVILRCLVCLNLNWVKSYFIIIG